MRRAKLYFLRDRVGKAAKLKTTFVTKSDAAAKAASAPAAAAAKAPAAAAEEPAPVAR